VSHDHIEITRRAYAAYNEAMNGPTPLRAIRRWLEDIVDPEVEWEPDPLAPAGGTTFRGVEEVMGVYERLLEAFDEVREIPERLIDAGDRVVVFVRTETRSRASAIDIDERLAHLVTYRDGRVVRFQVFRNRTEALRAAAVSE
jgi:ketosteroid isomerase-like protein